MAGGLPGVDDEDFEDFLSRIDEVSKTISGLRDGSVDPKTADVAQVKIDRDAEAERLRREAKKRAKIEERIHADAEREDRDILREVHREKVEELKRDYYHRKNRRERWEEYRRSNPSRVMDYRGWDLFEEDPDEDLWTVNRVHGAIRGRNPREKGDTRPQVQDQAAFDAMAKDVEQRVAKRAAQREASNAERQRGNMALNAGQFAEALARYDAAIEFERSDKSLYTNRALAHLRVGNCLSAAEDCSKALDIAEYLDDCIDNSPINPVVLKAYMRRASARAAMGKFDEADADLRAALRTASDADIKELRRLQRGVADEKAEADAEAQALSAAGDQQDTDRDTLSRSVLGEDGPGGSAGSVGLGHADSASVGRVHSICEALHAGTEPFAPKKGTDTSGGGGKAQAAAPAGGTGRVGKNLTAETAHGIMRRLEVTEEDDDSEVKSAAEASGGALARTSLKAGPASADQATEPAHAGSDVAGEVMHVLAHAGGDSVARVDRERSLLTELAPLLLSADAHRATARQCGFVPWVISRLGQQMIALEATRALLALCMSPLAQREVVQRGGVGRIVDVLLAAPTVGVYAGSRGDSRTGVRGEVGKAGVAMSVRGRNGAKAEAANDDETSAEAEEVEAEMKAKAGDEAKSWRVAGALLDTLRLCSATERFHSQLTKMLCGRHFLKRLAALAEADAQAPRAGRTHDGGGAENNSVPAPQPVGAGTALDRTSAALSALGICTNLSACADFKAHLATAATSDGGTAGAGGADVLGVLAAAARGDGDANRAAGVPEARRRLAVQSLGNLSSNRRLRALFAQLGVPAAISTTALRALGAPTHGASAADCAAGVAKLSAVDLCFVANAVSALHNLCEDDAAIAAHAVHLNGPLCALLALEEVRGDADIAGRALALLGRTARLPGAAAGLAADGAFDAAVALLRAHNQDVAGQAGAGVGAGARLVRETLHAEVTDEAESACGDEAAALTKAHHGGMGVGHFDVIGPAVKVASLILQADKDMCARLCEAGAIPAVASLLKHESAHVQGNAALCVGELALDERSLAVLALQPQLVEALLTIAHKKTGQLQRNAAIALARLAKNQRCLQTIHDNHGMQILMQYVKPR